MQEAAERERQARQEARRRRVHKERLAAEAAEREAAENAAAQARGHEDARIEAERVAELDRQRREAVLSFFSLECALSDSSEEEEEESDESEEDEDDEEESRFPPGFRPRQMCRFLLSGRVCPFAGQCTFAHHESELHPDSW